MDLEFIYIKMDLGMKDIGEMIFSMEWVMRYGVMGQSMLECIKMVKRVEMVGTNGQMDLIMKANG